MKREEKELMIESAMNKIKFLSCKILKRLNLNCTRVRQGKKIRYQTALRVLQWLSRK
jgi:hypothetical protein